MKRFLSLTLALLFTVSLAGCGGEEDVAQNNDGDITSAELFTDGEDAASDSMTDPDDGNVAEVTTEDANSTDNGDTATVEGDKKTVGFVTNGIASFWVIAEAGARQAAEDFGVNVEVRMPPNGPEDQKRMLEELVADEVDGIAVSPIDPDNQTELLNSVAEKTNLITHDSDAPNSNRIGYVGMSNYIAGRMCGELVKEALPDGGSLMIFVGRLEQLNARQRRQGVIDELLERDFNPERYDEPGQIISGEKYTILGTRTDNFDFAKAKSLAEDAIVAHPDMGAMIGLFAYNPPNMLEALKSADKIGQIKVIGFDEADETLQAIKDGHCIGTVVQDPYMYGYKSVEILTKLANDDDSSFADGDFIDIPARKVVAGDTDESKKIVNVDEFWTVLKQRTGQEE